MKMGGTKSLLIGFDPYIRFHHGGACDIIQAALLQNPLYPAERAAILFLKGLVDRDGVNAVSQTLHNLSLSLLFISVSYNCKNLSLFILPQNCYNVRQSGFKSKWQRVKRQRWVLRGAV